MTEEIIIDGANVAGCGAYKDKHCIDKTSIIFCDTNLCSNYPYCYYKQLKRLEQENKEEKKAYNECMHYLACMTEQRNKLKIALEEIREKVKNPITLSCFASAKFVLEQIDKKIDEVLK